MGTRSGIGIVDRDIKGKVVRVRGIYCHWDGYLEHNGVILAGSYTNADKVNALVELGDISCLRNEIGEKHNFNDMGRDAPQRVHGWTTAYGRDRGEQGVETRVFEGADAMSQFKKNLAGAWAEYLYLYDKGKWYWCQPSDRRWKVLGRESKPKKVAT